MDECNVYKGCIQSPDELMNFHEKMAFQKLIGFKKVERMANLMNDFKDKLLKIMGNDPKTIDKFYIAEVRGFIIKTKNGVDGEVKFVVDGIYAGPADQITPVMETTVIADSDNEVLDWIDVYFRKYLSDNGWNVGILSGKDSFKEKVIVYQVRKRTW